ncbi:MAG: hypothetical protein AD742_12220 [Methylibium sp. NZG]|nr:MAG: hypothetical protein AD742_12220 [Methylibium sp. NZG]
MKSISVVAAALALSGCAAFNQLNSEVSSYGQWPAERKPSSYVFERLPSQQARPERQQQLEDAARRAVESAGFTLAADEKAADVSIQLGVRVNAAERSPYDDPLWWRGGAFYSHYGRFGRGYWGPGLGVQFATPTYEREVALLIRDRKTGQALYEARASNDGASSAINSLLPAMFEAAMKDFPTGGINPRNVSVEIKR